MLPKIVISHNVESLLELHLKYQLELPNFHVGYINKNVATSEIYVIHGFSK